MSAINGRKNGKKYVLLAAIVIISGCVTKASPLQSRSLPSFNPIIKKLAPAVVNVKTEFVINNTANERRFFNKRDFDMPDYFKKYFKKFPKNPFPRLPKEFRKRGVGSGVIISRDGYILTNNHVVENANKIIVRMNNRDEFIGKIIGRDPKTDIALIKINSKKDLPFAELGDSSRLEIGDWVIAIGNPFGLEHTVTAGIVSAKGRKDINPGGRQGYYNFIQTDASINPGNSGGPLIDMNGRIVGINTAIIASGQGIGFAIPINMAKRLIPQLKAKGRVTRSWIGIKIQRVTDKLARSFGMEKAGGALISEVMKGGPGEKAGLKAGDIIIEFDRKKIIESSDLPLIASMAGIGKKTKIVILRDRKRKVITVVLGELPDDIGRSEFREDKSSSADVMGIKVKGITESIKKSLGLKDLKGVIVEDIDRGSHAYIAGLRKGHLILRLNGKDITGTADFKSNLEKVKKGDTVRIFIKITNGSIFIAFTK